MYTSDDELSILDDEEMSNDEVIAASADLIPSIPNSCSVTITEVQAKSTLEEVRGEDLKVNNVQILSLLHGLQHCRTIDSLCKVNEQISKTLRYRRDIMGMEKEKETKLASSAHAIIPLD